jgi:hypothetical protein
MTNFAAQASAVPAIILLVGYLFGVAFGVVGSAVFGSVRENRNMSLLEQAPDPICAGVREMFGVFTRDDGYLRSLPPSGRRTERDPRRDDPPGTHGQELDR